MYSKICRGKRLPHNFVIQKGLKQRDAVLTLLFSFASEYAIKKIQENQMILKINGTHQLLAYADDVKTKYVLLSRHQNANQYPNTKIY
jgi:hypothetical protein